jgi:type IV pilus assembly protein PilB
MRIKNQQLIDFLDDVHMVTDKELEKAKRRAKKENQDIGSALVNDGVIDPDELRRVKAHVMGMPFVNLKEKDIDFQTLSMIPEPVARNHNIIAYNNEDEELEVAMLDVDDLQAIDFVRKKTGKKIKPRMTDSESVSAALQEYQESLDSEFSDIIESESQELEAIPENKKENEPSAEELAELAEDLPVVRIVRALLRHAIIQDASDIHIEPMEEKVLVRYRIDGILHDAMELPAESAQPIVARIKVLSDLKLDEKRLPQDGRFKVEMEGEEVSFRVSILPTQYGEKVVMRLLKQNVEGFTLPELGFHGSSLDRVHWATKQSTGMVLVTGPTGSGKTTTLYTIMDILNTPEVNISTVEDPVEYQMKRVNQTQVKPDIGFTFSEGLRSLVRQDPDIIMVGEIRDEKTAHLAVNAALTGHLVFSTLHTNSAAGAVPRLLDMDAEAFLLVSTIRLLIGQRLVRELCDSREAYTLSDSELDRLEQNIDMDKVLATLKDEGIVNQQDGWQDVEFYKAVETDGCPDGFSGRIGIQEVLKMTPSIGELVMADETAETIENRAKKEGMLTMAEDGIYKAAKGVTTIEEVFRVVNN